MVSIRAFALVALVICQSGFAPTTLIAERRRALRSESPIRIPTPLDVVEFLRLDRNDALWFAGFRIEDGRRIDGLGRLQDGAARVIDIPSVIRDFTFSIDNRLWLITHSGLFRLSHDATVEVVLAGQFTQLDIDDERLLVYDPTLHQLVRVHATTLSVERTALPAGPVWTHIDAAGNGEIWFTTFDLRAGVKRGNRDPELFDLNVGRYRSENALSGIAADGSGGAWITVAADRPSGFVDPPPLLLHIDATGIVDVAESRFGSPFLPKACCGDKVIFLESSGHPVNVPRSAVVAYGRNSGFWTSHRLAKVRHPVYSTPASSTRTSQFVARRSSSRRRAASS